MTWENYKIQETEIHVRLEEEFEKFVDLNRKYQKKPDLFAKNFLFELKELIINLLNEGFYILEKLENFNEGKTNRIIQVKRSHDILTKFNEKFKKECSRVNVSSPENKEKLREDESNLLRERSNIDESLNQINELLETGNLVELKLDEQKSKFKKIQSNLKVILKNIPSINSIVNKIKTLKKKQMFILISICVFFMFILFLKL